MQTLNWKVMTVSLGLFFGFSFILCVAWGLAVPPGAHDTRFLEMTLPGFVWLTPGTFVLGLVETIVIGAYVGFVFTPIHNAVASHWR